MAFYIKKPSVMVPGKTVYYTGNNSWSEDASDKKTWSTSTTPTNLMVNTDGKNGGWTGATVVEE